MNQVNKIIVSVIIFFIGLLISTTVNANQLEEWISAGWSNGAPIAGTYWFANEAVAASLNQKNDFFDANPLYVCGGEITYQTPVCTHVGTSTYGSYCSIYSIHAAYCIDNGNYSGSGSNNRFLINNIVDLFPDGTVKVYSLSDTQWNTFGPGAYTTQMKQLAYLANRSNVADEWHVSSNSYKATLGSMIGYYRSTLINMGVDGSLSIKSNYGGSASSAKAQEAIRESANKNYRARLMFCVRNGVKGLGYGQSIVLFSAKEEEPNGNIEIIKTDSKTGKGLANVGLTLKMTSGNKAGQYVTVDGNGKAVYTTQESVLITGNNGRIAISDMAIGNYEIVEKINPNFGYEDNLPKVVKTGTISAGKTETITITNQRTYIKVSGYVWEDMISGKTSMRNYLYRLNDNDNQEEKKVGNVKVTLKKADGTILDTKMTVMDETSEKHGTYIFGDYEKDANAIKIKIEDLEGASVEFEYNGMCYQSVPIADAALKEQLAQANITVTDAELNEKGSKATDAKWREENFTKNFATIVNNQAIHENGKDTTTLEYNRDIAHKSQLIYGDNNKIQYGYEKQRFPVSEVYDQYKVIANTKDANPNKLLGQDLTKEQIMANEIKEITNVNLGLEERAMPDLIVMKDLQEAKVSINGYGHRYEYANRYNDPEKYAAGFNMSVKFGTERGKESYTREIYASDITYTNDKNKELEAYLTYRIEVTNESTTITSRLNRLVDYYDNNYQLEAAGESIGTDGSIQDKIIWTEGEVYNDEYNKIILTKQGGWEIAPQTKQTIYVQFKMSREKIAEIALDANGDTTNQNQRIFLDNVVEIDSYSSTIKGQNGTSSIYAGIDQDSNPGNAIPGEVDTYEDDTESAPDFRLQIANARKITGNVFLDGTDPNLRTGQERLGDGEYQEGEETISGVSIKMVNEDGQEVGTVRTTGENGKTGEDGYFEISNFVPGKYTIVYTWGDKTYTNVTNQRIKVEDYKATIYQEPNRQNDLGWYRDNMETPRYSDALDNYEIRKEIDKENTTITTMDSTTPTMEFGVELKDDLISKVTLEPNSNTVQFVIPNIDFGIVERARQVLDIDKRASSMKITLANGQVLIDAQIEEIDGKRQITGKLISGVAHQGPSNSAYEKNGFLKAEIDDELIQGATLEVGYEIAVSNKSEVDYDSEEYYHYGSKVGDIIKVQPVGVYDYLDREMVLDEEKNSQEWEEKTMKQYNESVTEPTIAEDYLKQYYSQASDSVGNTTTVMGYEFFAEQYKQAISNWTRENIQIARQKRLADKTILHHSNLEKALDIGEENKAELYTSKVLASSDEIRLDNDVEITKVVREQETGRKVTVEVANVYDRAETVIVTGNTGDNHNYFPYIMLGISMFILLSTGIVLIKKKVLP